MALVSVNLALTLGFVASAGVSLGALIGAAATNISDGVLPVVVTSAAALPGIILGLSASGVLTGAILLAVWWVLSGLGEGGVPRYVYGASALGVGAAGAAMALSAPLVAGAGAVAARTGLEMFSALEAPQGAVVE